MKHLLILIITMSLFACTSTNRQTQKLRWTTTINQALALEERSPITSFELMDSLLASDKSDVSDTLQARAHMLKGVFSSKLGQLEESRKELLIADKFFKKNELSKDQGDVSFNLGRISVIRGKLDEGVAHYEKAISTCKPGVDTTLISMSYSHMCEALFKLGKYELAKEILEQGLTGTAVINDMTTIYTLLGELSVITNDSTQAQMHFRKALEYAQVKKKSAPLTYANTAATLARHMPASEERARLATEADITYASIPKSYMHSELALNLWRYYKSAQNTELEALYFQEAWTQAEQLKNPYNLAVLNLELAKSELSSEESDLCIKHFNEAFDLAINSGAYGIAEESLQALENLYKDQKNDSELARCKALAVVLKNERSS